ncbi:hypothetical protein [Deinococcus ficus]|uniref:hypothetical protein n=1 Tax=Deinococcus ficus TaxID=317577 RepID=UPI00174A0EC6|nr:hypothetical protein [Deinococcus ficus]GHF78792.1 hypothetical protein GCM10017782_15950 [Deinococcus ficus]
MPLLFDLLLGVLLVIVLQRSARLERKLDEALRHLSALQPAPPSSVTPPDAVVDTLPTGPTDPPQDPHLPPVADRPRPVWPEDLPATTPPARVTVPQPVTPAPGLLASPETSDAEPRPARSRAWMPDIDLGAPEYSRARMSVIGGGLVIAGLAWTLRALGLPGWTTLAAVYGFAALLWLTARSVPQPVAGALRGLAYAAAALGLGSLAGPLGDAGPAVVMAGLLALSAVMAWRSVQAGEPLLAAMATAGAAVSTWMLTDDLGLWSPLAMGLAGLIPALAVAPLIALLPAERAQGNGEPAGLAREASLVLTVLAAAALPAGHVLAALSHAEGPGTLIRDLHLGGWGPWTWAAGSVLALGTAAFLLRGAPRLPGREERGERPAYRELGTAAALCAAAPAVSATAALGAGVYEGLPQSLAATLTLAAVTALLAALAWRAQRREATAGRPASAALTGTLAGAATAGTTSLVGAALTGLLGARTRPLAFTGLGAALAGVGLAARSGTWVRLGVGLTGLSLLAAVAAAEDGSLTRTLAWLTAAALVGSWLLSLRISLAGWRSEAGVLSVVTGTAAALMSLAGPLEAATAALLPGALLWSTSRPSSGGATLGSPFVPLRAGLQVTATVGALAAAIPSVMGEWTGELTGWALLWAALVGSVLALLASRADPSPAPVTVTETTGMTSSLPPLAPTSQHAAWAATAALLAAAGFLAGASAASAAALSLAGMAAVSHLAGLRRGPLLSSLALVVAALLVSAETVDLIMNHLWPTHEGQFVRAGTASLRWLPVAAWSALGVWALLHTPTGRSLWVRWTRPLKWTTLPPMPARILRAPLIAGGLALASLTLWVWLPSALARQVDGPLATLGSLGALATGVLVALGAWRWGGVGRGGARPLWDMGVGIGAVAGGKAAVLDAALYANSRAASGLAVLMTGLALLLLAVRAPRPGPGEGADGTESDPGAALTARLQVSPGVRSADQPRAEE